MIAVAEQQRPSAPTARRTTSRRPPGDDSHLVHPRESMTAIGELRTSVRRKGAANAPKRNDKAAYLFLLPWLLGFFGLAVIPMASSLYLSFTDYNLIQAPQWIGLDNFVRMLHDDRMWNSLRVTFTYVLVSVPLQLIFALAVAMLLDRGMRGMAFYRSIFYLPSLLGSSVAVAILWRQVFGTDGLVNQVLGWFG